MKLGRQNEAIGSDPTVFPRSDVILSQMYSGGFSTVVDASKLFYQFKTHPVEHKYLGLIHPITGKRYFYRGLPMGSGNSPSLAGQYGNSFLRIVRERCPAFRGQPATNTWWDEFSQRQKMNGQQCKESFLVGKDGLPAAQVWAHCDDFIIHASTYKKTMEALRQFLDASVDVGILCHPGKLIPPAHVVKNTGFLFDITNEPALRIPTSKRERSLAMIEYFLGLDKPFSRRALAVLIGVLESVTDATPARQCHTHLRNLYSTLHPPGWEGLPYNSTINGSFGTTRQVDRRSHRKPIPPSIHPSAAQNCLPNSPRQSSGLAGLASGNGVSNRKMCFLLDLSLVPRWVSRKIKAWCFSSFWPRPNRSNL
jgi:hypothetical protein